MSGLLGLPLSVAEERIARDGLYAEIVEARTHKGSGGSDARVIREESLPNGGVRITYALFITKPEADRPA